ncbi:MAG TPA: class I fructose-bisphosphate aldolase [Candidatus Paceibacterota bacterium]
MVDLSATAKLMVAPGKGLLAADESTATAGKRLAQYGIRDDTEMRRKYRELFLDAPGVEEYLSGVILYEETTEENADSGTPFVKLLAGKGILPGIKVDKGTEPFPGSAGELITNGLVGLSDRLECFAAEGLTFTKWRAVITIDGDKLPTPAALVENAKRLATYALEAQKAGMVPILEPEVLLDGNHSRIRARDVITETMKALFAALEDQSADLSGIIIKTSMALSGAGSGHHDAPEEVAESTLDALMNGIPAQVPGVVFLSGGQSPQQATDNLRAVAQRARAAGAPWPLTFSYARALQEEAMELWKGDDANMPAARAAFLARLKKVSDAARGA